MSSAKFSVIGGGDVYISSKYDSGNLGRIEPGASPNEYNLWTRPDCFGTQYENGNRTWFNFSVDVPKDCHKIIKFNIHNLNRQTKLYRQGMVPVFQNSPGAYSRWERLRGSVDWKIGDEGLILNFEYKIASSRPHTVYFAFCYPFSYSDCQKKLCDLDQRYGLIKVPMYYHRELLCHSIEGRRIDLLTVSSAKGITETKEPRIAGLFPDDSVPRAHRFVGKKVFFVTSRVHPGETPSSHVFNGLLDFLLSEDDKRAEAIRDNFVVKMIPMLNPDGVADGHYRTDTRGVNLNRFYLNPDPQLHPSIFATKRIILHHHYCEPKGFKEELTNVSGQSIRTGSAKLLPAVYPKRHRSHTYPQDHFRGTQLLYKKNEQQTKHLSGVALYVDLHAHATKRGCFFYGNHLENERKQVENMLYPKLVSLNTPHLDFEHCVFSEKNMYTVDKQGGTTKEGCGRVAMFKATGLIHCYTLECNYNSGRMTNAISAATNDDGRASPSQPSSSLPYKYDIASYQQVGRALAVGLLDMYSLNPWSRIPTSESGSLQAIRSSLALRIRSGCSNSSQKKEVTGIESAKSLCQGHNNISGVVKVPYKHIKVVDVTKNCALDLTRDNTRKSAQQRLLPKRSSTRVTKLTYQQDHSSQTKTKKLSFPEVLKQYK